MVSVLVFLGMFLIGYLFYSRPKSKSPVASLHRRQTANVKVPNKFGAGSSEAVWTAKLLEITRGNKGAIERGILARRRLHPQASRVEVLEMLYQDDLRDRS